MACRRAARKSQAERTRKVSAQTADAPCKPQAAIISGTTPLLERRNLKSRRLSTTAGVCGLSFLQRRCEAMSSRSEAEDWAEELEAVAGRIAPRFGRAEPRRRALAYFYGLLGPLGRKNGWHLAQAAGHRPPHRLV